MSALERDLRKIVAIEEEGIEEAIIVQNKITTVFTQAFL
jgi:hypothetical protein